MGAPFLTIAIPTFNRSNYLDQCLFTLRGQGKIMSDVEVIVCDNASTDNIKEIVELHNKSTHRIRYIRNDENIGFDRNYIRCLKEARGERLWVLGDDDALMPGAIDKFKPMPKQAFEEKGVEAI